MQTFLKTFRGQANAPGTEASAPQEPRCSITCDCSRQPYSGHLPSEIAWYLNINGCQSINKSAIDTLLRLTHDHLPLLKRIHMEGLRLELCQQAAKSFLREKLNKSDSLGTMGAFTLGPTGAALPNEVGKVSLLAMISPLHI